MLRSTYENILLFTHVTMKKCLITTRSISQNPNVLQVYNLAILSLH